MLNKTQKRIIADEIENCFRNVNWNVQHFSCNNIIMTDKNNNSKFYSIKNIDNAIKKLNKLINKLNE